MKSKFESNAEFSTEDWLNQNLKYTPNTINIGSLFSGIGSFEQAFLKLKLPHKILFAGDIDEHVKKSYIENYEIDEKNWHNDIREFDSTKFRDKVDIIAGGSPCQSFSLVGNRKGLEDTRGTLFYDFARIIQESQPKAFIFENVRGLVNHDNGKTWEVIRTVFNEINYKIFYKILNSKDFGIPQNRERIFVVGFKDNKQEFLFPKKIELNSTMQDFLEDYIDTKYYLKDKGVKFVTSSKNRKKRYTQINGKIALCQKANQQFNWHGDFIFESANNLKTNEYVFDINEVEEKYYLSQKVKDYVLSSGTKNFKTSVGTDLELARPILQTVHKMHRSGVDNYVTHSGSIRKLTPKECLRLMGFSEDFKIVVSDTQMYRQAGNSIVVNIIIAILKQMKITEMVN
ncbi:MAG: DNA (cytosine-5-)-methyltransferase [Chloroflexi bacterium]|nr:DNA (cytosine-5-)-methyltransferase [Chloroflexota bacterium]|tara:strand:+ start:794 stop:1993 length:1200 start_codon:yes stop_codon:yes gene_type:complete